MLIKYVTYLKSLIIYLNLWFSQFFDTCWNTLNLLFVHGEDLMVYLLNRNVQLLFVSADEVCSNTHGFWPTVLYNVIWLQFI